MEHLIGVRDETNNYSRWPIKTFEQIHFRLLTCVTSSSFWSVNISFSSASTEWLMFKLTVILENKTFFFYYLIRWRSQDKRNIFTCIKMCVRVSEWEILLLHNFHFINSQSKQSLNINFLLIVIFWKFPTWFL